MDIECKESEQLDFEALARQADERWAELHAMVAAQRLVLEQLCIENFMHQRPEHLVKFMQRLIDATWSTTVTTEALDSGDAMKRQARTALIRSCLCGWCNVTSR